MIMISCNRKSEQNSLDAFPLLKSIKDSSLVYVIPGAGCSDCISKVENLAVKKIDADSFYFVFTRIHSLKFLNLKFPGLTNSKNIILDTSNLFVFPLNHPEIYPLKYIKENDKFILKTVNPSE